MKNQAKRSSVVQDSLTAIQNVNNRADLRGGLAKTMSALLHGDVSSEDGRAIAWAVRKRGKEIDQGVLKAEE